MENWRILMASEVKNATISYTKLGVPCSDHGVLSFCIGLDYGGAGQGYGHFALDEYDKEKDKRVSTTLCGSLLLALDAVFSTDWEDLKGLPCRALGNMSKVIAIGNYLEDKWLWMNFELMEFSVTKLEDIEYTE